MTAPEWTLNPGWSRGKSPQTALGRKASPEPDIARACRYCCAYLAFRRGAPSVIDASDRVEYAAHLLVSHGFVR